MTVLRRVAQLVKDLRTLNVIKKDDFVEFSHSHVIILRILLNKEEHQEIDSKTITTAIKEEFSEDSFEFLTFKTFDFSIGVCFKPKG